MRACVTLSAALSILLSSAAAAQFTASLPMSKITVEGKARFNRPFNEGTSGETDVPNLILPQIGTGFSSDRAYVVGTAFTGQGKVDGHGFNIDVNGAKVVSSSDEADPLKRKAIRDTKSVATLLIENTGDVGLRVYGCPKGCGPGAPESAGNNPQKWLFGLSVGSYRGTDTSRHDPDIAFGPIVQYYHAFALSDPKSSKGIGHLLIGGRMGVVALGGGALSDVPDSREVRYASETLALVVNNAILFGVTLTQTQSSLKPFIPKVQVTTTASLK